MAMKKQALGKGLGALLANNVANDSNRNVLEVNISDVKPGKGQPRKTFDKEKLEALATSIKQHGIIQPLIVNKEGNTYYIIAGERRWRAATLAGLKTVPVIEKSVTDKEYMELALIENIQREDLNPIEEAQAYARLINEYDMTQEQLSEVIGKSRSAIANTLRLLNFSEEIMSMIISGELNPGQARPLLALPDNKKQIAAAKYVIENEFSARQSENYVKELQTVKPESKKVDKKKIVDPDIEDINQKLQSALGTKVTLDDKNDKGRIVIEYYSSDERERLIELLTGKK